MKYYEPFSYNLCCCCGKTMGMKICSNGHRMCMVCLAGNAITRLQFRCLLCQEKISATLREEMFAQITAVTGITRENITMLCEGCGVESHFSEFVESWESQHGCLICRECRRRSEVYCLSCERPLPTSPAMLRSANMEVPAGRLRCESCQNDKGITEFGAYLLAKHECVRCDICIGNSSIHGVGYCTKCRLNAFSDERNKGKPENYLLISCQSCRSIKEMSEYSIWSRLSHWFKCRICNFCLKSKLTERPPAYYCPICCKDYSQSDSKILSDERQALLVEKREAKAAERDILRCVKCGQQQAPQTFSLYYQLRHTCLVCDKCFASHPANIGDFWGLNQQCPECKTTFKTQESREIHEYVNKLATGEKYLCRICKSDRGEQEMTKCLSLTHHCKICNECLRNPVDPTRCPACQDKLSGTDLVKLGRASRQCRCGNEIAENSSMRCPQKCLCSLCLMKNYLICGQLQCPECTLGVTGYRLISPTCSYCHRRLNGSSHEITEKVAGVCSKMHVLCCFCIDIHSSLSFCNVCLSSVELKAPAAITSEQMSFQLACFCGKSSMRGHFKILTCRHEIHRECEDSTYLCRLCKAPVKTAPPSKCLRDYLQ